MGVVRSSNTTTIQFQSSTTAAELAAAIADVPPYATVRAQHYAGDQREPAYTTLTFTWDPKRGT